ncbi:EAL domain-containing protein [Azoarcus sp. L1K30]|uniref:EAL domain-containing protein n=1 Tax=Azoarcus sp. L1K30 TaxID=2820277 RepID=UPI001B823DB4|nr:EAL domain-containing protein [Azoarcus sp. L1K30]MBR0565876.1 EAL domain-containing protein [Azoarcus sp. L1K30]
MFVSKPVLGRVSKRWSIQFTRPIINADASFGGVIVISVAPEYFSNFYKKISLGEGGVVNLFRASGEILARSPDLDDAIGKKVDGLIPADLRSDGSDVIQHSSSVDGVERIYGVRGLPALGLIVSVGKSVDSIDAVSAQERTTLLIAGLAMTALIVAFAVGVLVSLRQRAQAAARIAATEEQDRVLTTALEAAPNAIVITDADVRIQWANPAFTALTGYTLHEAIGHKPAELVKSGLQPPAFYEKMWKVLSAGQVWRGELFNRRKDGSIYCEELVIAPVRIDGRAATHFVGIKTDISDRKAAEQTIARVSQRYQMMLHMASDGVYILNADGKFLEVSNASAAMLGYERSELLEMSVFDIDASHSRADIERLLAERIEPKSEHAVFETRHRGKDGRIVDVEISTAALVVDGEPVIFSSVRNITERKRTTEALNESEARWKFALEGAGDGVFDWDLATDRFTLSATANQFLGEDEHRTVDSIAGWERRVHPMDASGRRAALQSYLNGESSTFSCEYRVRTCLGRWVWILSRGAVIKRGADGTALRMVGTIVDIDRRRRDAERSGIRTRMMEELARGGSLQRVLDTALSGMARTKFGLAFAVLMTRGNGVFRVISAPDEAVPLLGRTLTLGSDEVKICTCGHLDGGPAQKEENSGYWLSLREFAEPLSMVPRCSEPLMSRAGEIDGMLVVFGRQQAELGPSDRQDIQEMSALISIAIQRKRADEQLQLAASVYDASSESVMILDADNRILAVNPAFNRTTGYAADDVIGRNPRILSSGRQSSTFYRAMWDEILKTGSWQGEIWNRRKNGEIFAEWLTIDTVHDDAGEILRRVAIFTDVTERKAAEEKVWLQANYDALTGLPNRQLFYDRMSQALRLAAREGTSVALLFIDLDHFKDVNDTLGHDAGDALLKEAALRISACVRKSDTVARLGGDEFTVLVAGLKEAVVAERLARAIVASVMRPFTLKSERAYVSASVGMTLFPDDGDDVETLFKHADQAMYAAKAAGRNGYSWFTADLQQAAEWRRNLAHDLRQALHQNQLEVYYQPIVDMRTGAIVKAEALLRWHHPERGMVGPAEFIPIAEEIGLIGEIGDWVFMQVAGTAASWRSPSQASAMPPIEISINKSPRQFATAGTHDAWLKELERLQLPGSAIIVEITEGLLLDDRTEVTERLHKLRGAGVRLALDDFGTGYSAMGYLQRYDIDFLKIDRSFVSALSSSPGDRAISEAIIAMAHKLGIQVVAEGIENEDQHNILHAAGCDFGQGFLFARPMPMDDFEAFCKDARR